MSTTQNINKTFKDYGSYKLTVTNHTPRETNITMLLETPHYHTKHLPFTHSILENILPQILHNECLNDSNLPFKEEVKNTEIGHLFEHIILEYLCQIKVKNGHRKASFTGVTEWDWKKDARGTYHIKIKMKNSDKVFFESALNESINLLNKILIGASSVSNSIN